MGWNHGGTKEILSELFPQGLVELGNLSELKNKSIDLLSQEELRPKKNIFTSERMINSTLSVYESLLRTDK